jgi:hypothetical protein
MAAHHTDDNVKDAANQRQHQRASADRPSFNLKVTRAAA